MDDILDLAGKRALVTGAGQGVGREIALRLAAFGAAVVVNDYHADRATAVVGEITAAGGRALSAECDVTNFEHVQRMVGEAGQKMGGIDILVNNAGNAGPELDPTDNAVRFWETGPDEWAPWMGTNYYGVLNCTRSVLPGMVEKEWGRVVTIISDAGRVGEPNLVVYSGAKAGAAGFSRALAKAVGRYNVTVNCVALSSIRTPGVSRVLDNEELVRKMLSRYVVRRVGQPTDVANMVLFLASNAAEWITGQTYPVNGGYSFAV
jgi:2-hydroxycyclohexanecarboxyl-CoA dehydrogenase